MPESVLKATIDSVDFTRYIAAYYEGMWALDTDSAARVCQAVANFRPFRSADSKDVPLEAFVPKFTQPDETAAEAQPRMTTAEMQSVIRSAKKNWPKE
jgi:hypothetical protein